MLTFQNIKKADLISKLEAHAKADAFIRGTYGKEIDGVFKGCAVGCTLYDYGVKPNDHSAYPDLFGIPEQLAHLEDTIFEGLPEKEGEEWPLMFAHAVPENVYLEQVFPKFQIAILTDPEHGVINYAETDEQRKTIQDCADIYLTWPNVDKAEARATEAEAWATWAARATWAAEAAEAAWAAAWAARAVARVTEAGRAARAAAWAAAWASYAAWEAAWAAARKNHYIWMAELLIKLLEETKGGE